MEFKNWDKTNNEVTELMKSMPEYTAEELKAKIQFWDNMKNIWTQALEKKVELKKKHPDWTEEDIKRRINLWHKISNAWYKFKERKDQLTEENPNMTELEILDFMELEAKDKKELKHLIDPESDPDEGDPDSYIQHFDPST